MPQCRICHELIDKNKDDWILPVRNWYYHKKCYEDWKKGNPVDDEEYVDYIFDFISRDLKVKYDFFKISAQIEKFKKDNMTVKGQFFALKYFYEVQHGDWNKGHGGIGIIPYVYRESCEYWAAKERANKGIIQQIESQMAEARAQEPITIRRKRKKKKDAIDLSIIKEMEDS